MENYLERTPSHEKEPKKIIDTLEISAGNFSILDEMKRVANERGENLDIGESIIISDFYKEFLMDGQRDLRGGKPAQLKQAVDGMRVVLDNASMPFSDSSVKRIVCANFFSSESHMATEYRDGGNNLEVVRRYIKEIRRVLIPGGYLFIHDTLSPEVSDFIFESQIFNDDFEEIDMDKQESLKLSLDFINQIKNRFGEEGLRGIKVFRKK